MGISVSFFKKTKSKKASKASDQTKLEHEIKQMDQELNLDERIEELTATLNISPSDELGQAQIETETPNIINTIEDINGDLDTFAVPELSATVVAGSKIIDVTSQDIDSSNESTNTAIESEAPDESKHSSDTLEPDPSLSHPSRLNIAEMRIDVAQISSDIQSGEELYRRALQRVEGLMGQVEKAEIDFSVLNRLEPENRRLKARLRTAKSDAENKSHKLSLVTADLEDHQERLAEKTTQYEQGRAKLVKATKALQEYDRILKQNKLEIERHSLTLDRNKTALNVESQENKVLREKISDLVTDLETRQGQYLEASKMVESLRTDCDEFRTQAETYRSEVQDMRITLNKAKRQNNIMKGEMVVLHDDIKTFKTQYEFNVINREDQITDLEAKLVSTSKEMDAIEHVSKKREAELSNIRKVRIQQDIERERLEKELDAAKLEIRDIKKSNAAQNSEEVSLLKKDINELQADLRRRNEIADQASTEVATLKRQITSLEIEREKLQSKFDIQTNTMEKLQKDNPAPDLEIQINALTQQLGVKDEIIQNTAKEMVALRKSYEVQNTEQKRLEGLIHAQTYQLEAAQKALLDSKRNESELDQRYKDVAAALSVTNARRQTESPNATPDIAPDLSDSKPDTLAEDIEKRILDYKFGIIDKIV